jgi:CheY-like chemotaxis protein
MARKLHILIIDGSPVHIKVLQHLLQDSKGPYRVTISETLVGGYDTLEEEDVDLVLLDLNLPGTKEYQLLPNFRNRFPEIPVILLVNRDNEVLFQQAVKAGISDFLIKGEIEARQLRRSITLAIHTHQTNAILRENNQVYKRVRQIQSVAEKLTGYGVFTLDIVSNRMEWTTGVFEALGIRQGTLSKPMLSSFLDRVHHLDRALVADFFLRTAEETAPQSLKHRILREGHLIQWVTLEAVSTYLSSTNQTVIVGVVYSTPKSENSNSEEPKDQGYIFSVNVSLQSALEHHNSSLQLYQELSDHGLDPIILKKIEQLKIEHEVLTELFYRSVKENLGALTSNDPKVDTFQTRELGDHIQNYFWMRITNSGNPLPSDLTIRVWNEWKETTYSFSFYSSPGLT